MRAPSGKMILAEEILEYDDDGNPVEKIVLSMTPDGDVDISYRYKNELYNNNWTTWKDQGATVSPSIFLKAAEELLKLADDEEES